MLRLGQTKGIYLRLRTATFGDFHLIERRILNTPSRPCKEDDSFSFTGCMMEFIARRVGCHLDWVGRRKNLQYPPCLSYQEVSRYSDFLSSLLDYSWIRLTRESGCHGKCRYKQFNFNKVRQARNTFHFPPAQGRNNRLECQLLLLLLPDGREDVSGGTGGAPGL